MVRLCRATTPTTTRHSIADDTGDEEQGREDGALLVQPGNQQTAKKKIYGGTLENC